MKIKDIAGNKHEISGKQLAIAIGILIVMLAAVMIVGGLIAKHPLGILDPLLRKLGL